MGGIKELRQRIKSVGNIKQITRAMEMVATTKLRRFQDRAMGSRPYTEEISSLVGRLASALGGDVADRPLFQEGPGEASLVLLVTSDRGLCGSYNSNLLRYLEEWLEGREQPVHFFVYGRKGASYLAKTGRDLKAHLSDPPLESVDFRHAADTARQLVEAFEGGDYKDVWVLYSAFESMSRYVPTLAPFLPIAAEGLMGDEESAVSDVILEPDAASIFDHLIPRFLEIRVYNALIEALTSEYASRRFAMKNATDAATDMQGLLRGVYNRKRQETITKELLDIVGGAEALR